MVMITTTQGSFQCCSLQPVPLFRESRVYRRIQTSPFQREVFLLFIPLMQPQQLQVEGKASELNEVRLEVLPEWSPCSHTPPEE